MACYRQRLGKEIGYVEGARHEDDPEVSLTDAVPQPQPMKAHVKGLRHLQIYAIICETDGDLIVAENRGRRLGMAHVGQNLAFVRGDSTGGEETATLSLCYKGEDDWCAR
jgi:hypothetical protein